MLRLIAAAAATLLLGGCNMINCEGAAGGHSSGADCGLHTTFFASSAAKPHPGVLAKS